MRLVILESPYNGDVDRNVKYARAALRDSLQRGEAPIASHLLYTQPGVLKDTDPIERAMGIAAGLAWGKHAEATVVHIDYGSAMVCSRASSVLARKVGRLRSSTDRVHLLRQPSRKR